MRFSIRRGSDMADSRLVLHCGAREVTREELDTIGAPRPPRRGFPPGTRRSSRPSRSCWPTPASRSSRRRFGLSRNDMRMFSMFDLASPLASGVNLAVGVRNSGRQVVPARPRRRPAGVRAATTSRSGRTIGSRRSTRNSARPASRVPSSRRSRPSTCSAKHESSRIKRLRGLRAQRPGGRVADAPQLRAADRLATASCPSHRRVAEAVVRRLRAEGRLVAPERLHDRARRSRKSNPQEHAGHHAAERPHRRFVRRPPPSAPARADGEEANGHA